MSGRRWQRLFGRWEVKSLLVGGGSVVLALVLGWLVLWLDGSTRAAAMVGTGVGWVFTYFANRAFAFSDSDAPLASSGVRFTLMAIGSSLAQGQVVVWLCDGLGLPYTVAKLIADAVVVTVPNLLIMRYLVFPSAAVEKKPHGP